jgi:hypothetical protein
MVVTNLFANRLNSPLKQQPEETNKTNSLVLIIELSEWMIYSCIGGRGNRPNTSYGQYNRYTVYTLSLSSSYIVRNTFKKRKIKLKEKKYIQTITDVLYNKQHVGGYYFSDERRRGISNASCHSAPLKLRK